MKIRTRLILLLSLVIFIFLSIFIFFRNSERKTLVLLFQNESDEKKEVFNKFLMLKGKSLETLAYDYTYWDEMVNFINTGNKAWAEKMIDATALSNYSVNAIWIYKPGPFLIYSINNLEDSGLRELALPEAAFDKLYLERFCHFFLNTPKGLMEIRGATVHPTYDTKRKSLPQGYFLVGRLWNNDYIAELSKLIGSPIEITPVLERTSADSFNPEEGIFTFTRILTGWDRRPLMQLKAEVISESVKNFNLRTKKYFIILIIFTGVIIVTVAFFTISWIGIPLYSITRTLEREDLSYINRLQKDKTEFGEISRLIDKFFKQREELLNEVARRKKTEGVLKDYTRQLEEINKELDDFTYIVSHDLKEPLRSIDAFSKFIEVDYKDQLGERGRAYLERIKVNAARMQSLIEDLLEVSRIERKKNLFEEVEAEEFITETKLRLDYAIKQKGAEIVIKDKLPKIFCDKVRLTEVFLNLISNAVKFNDKSNTRVEIGVSSKGLFYEFYVKDNGPGIEKQYFDKIFKIFQRLGKREEYEGTGVGLTIAKKIVEMHKGRIWLESKVGEGTTFYFTILKNGEVLDDRRSQDYQNTIDRRQS